MIEPIRELIGVLLAARKARGLTRSQLAQACSVHETVLKHIERGEVEPTLSLLLDYSHAVGLSLTWRLAGTRYLPPRTELRDRQQP